MTRNVTTVTPDMRVEAVARLFLDRQISGAPVVDADGAVIGIVSEGDLIRRPDIETGHRRRSWWLSLLSDSREEAAEYIKEHGHCVVDVMTRDVLSIDEDTAIGDVARLLEKRRIKRVPVLRDGAIVGIVSRANLLQALAAHDQGMTSVPTMDDRALRDSVHNVLMSLDWLSHGALNVIVNDGRVELWGQVDSEEERKATLIAVHEVPGVASVEDHLYFLPPYLRSD